MTCKQIPLARPNLTQAEIDAVVQVLQGATLSLGPKLPAFEKAFADHCGTRHAVACSSGTAGLHLLVRAVGIEPGDEVITTPFSFVASANCAVYEGAKPVFVDIDPGTWNLDPTLVEQAVTAKSKAVIPVDVFGQIADMTAILAIAADKGLRVIEDSCEALGSTYKGKQAGSFGDAGVFGFYPNKQITTGEGGMIVTDDEEIARLCRSGRNQGRDTNGGWLAHPRLGFNYRMSDINCALGIVQLGRLPEIAAERTRVYTLYRDRLSDEKRVSLQKLHPDTEVNWFVFVLRLDERYSMEDRNKLLHALREEGIGCSNYFAPIHLQPYFMEHFGYKRGDFPICEALADRTIALPFHHELSSEDVDRVCSSLQRLL